MSVSASPSTSTLTPTPSPTRDYNNLPIGDRITVTLDGSEIGTMAVLDTKYTKSPYRDKPLFAAKVRTCATEQNWSDVSSSGWVAETADGDQYPAANDQGEGDPTPMYPLFDRKLNKGRCVQGWIPFEIDKGAKISHVGYQLGSDEDSSTVYWKVG